MNCRWGRMSILRLTTINMYMYSYYPNDAYVLWTFYYHDYETGQDITDIVYQIVFDSVYLGQSDFLRIGSGWDPDKTSAVIAMYGSDDDWYWDTPDDLFIDAGKMFVEFDADSTEQWRGFSVTITVRNVTGTNIYIYIYIYIYKKHVSQ